MNHDVFRLDGWWFCFALMGALAMTAGSGPASADTIRSVRSRHYIVQTDLPAARATELVSHMDEVYACYLERFAAFRPKNPSRPQLYLFAKRDDYNIFLSSKGIDARNSGGMFAYNSLAGFHGLLTFTENRPLDDTLAVLQHEGFHQFAWAYLGYELPPWANEGLAQYFEDAVLIKGRMHLGMVNPVRLAEVKAALAAERPPVSFSQLLSIDSQSWSQTLATEPGKASVLYAWAWSVAHFLIHADNERYAPAFGRYLEEVAKGRTSREAFAKVFGASATSSMERRWRAYIDKLEPDPLAEAAMRLRMIAAGQVHLQKVQEAAPGTLDELAKVLARYQFRWGYSSEGQVIELTAADPANFTYRDKQGRTQPFALKPAQAQDGLPPVLSAPGLRPTPSVQWRPGPDGELDYRLVYR